MGCESLAWYQLGTAPLTMIPQVVHNLGFLGLMVSSAYVSFKTIF